MRLRTATCLAVVAVSMPGCSGESPQHDLQVVVTVLPLAGIVDRVAPGLVETTAVIPAGANPVTYEPSLSDLREASAADLLFEVGHPALTWERTWIGGLASEGGGRVITAAHCPTSPDDPHVWLSPSCASMMAQVIAEAITAALPEAGDSIAAALDLFLAEIADVSREAEVTLGGRPGAAFLVLHPAWGYIARAYGLEQLAILDHGSGDAGPGRLAEVIERAKAEGLQNVIVQPQFSTEPAEIVARELGGRVVALDPLERDWCTGMRRAIQAIGSEVAR
jgi:zinc transport system substrate-binding protein